MIQLVALAHQVHPPGVGGGEKPLVDRVVNHRHFLGLDVEEPQDVALGGLRHRQDAIGLARRAPHRRLRVDIRQLARQVLREHQVNAIVNGHD